MTPEDQDDPYKQTKDDHIDHLGVSDAEHVKNNAGISIEEEDIMIPSLT